MLAEKNYFSNTSFYMVIFDQEVKVMISQYQKKHCLTQKQLAKKIYVSEAYLSQLLNGKINYTVKTLIALGFLMGKAPFFEFVDKEEYMRRKKIGRHIIKNHPYPWIDIKRT